MRKLSILLFVLLSLTGCKNNGEQNQNTIDFDKDNIATENNISDSDTMTLQENVLFTFPNNDIQQCYKRESGTTGILGTWKLVVKDMYDDYSKEVTFNNNGTYVAKVDNYKNNRKSNYEGKYELYKQSKFFYIRIFYNEHEYNVRYVCSDNYFCSDENSPWSSPNSGVNSNPNIMIYD